MIERLDQEGAQRTGPSPIQGEAQPIPPQQHRVQLPISPPRAAWVLLVVNIAIFLIPEVLGLSEFVLDWGAKSNRAIRGGEFYRFLTSMFLHGSLIHIGFNAFALYSFGFDTERLYGTLRFLAIYFLAGFGGGLASYALSPFDSVGASGAIFGLIGAMAAFYYLSRNLFGEMSRQQLGSLVFVILINLGIGFSTPRIDNMAHIGGLIIGGLAGLLLAPRLIVDQRVYPPVVVRHSFPFAWPGALALFVVLVVAAILITPP